MELFKRNKNKENNPKKKKTLGNYFKNSKYRQVKKEKREIQMRKNASVLDTIRDRQTIIDLADRYLESVDDYIVIEVTNDLDKVIEQIDFLSDKYKITQGFKDVEGEHITQVFKISLKDIDLF